MLPLAGKQCLGYDKDTGLGGLESSVLHSQTPWRTFIPLSEMQSGSPLSPEHSQQSEMKETLRHSW